MINNCLKKVAENHENVHFVPLSTLCRYHYTSHGLHLNKSGKREFANILKGQIESIKKQNSNTIMQIPVRITTNLQNQRRYLNCYNTNEFHLGRPQTYFNRFIKRNSVTFLGTALQWKTVM